MMEIIIKPFVSIFAGLAMIGLFILLTIEMYKLKIACRLREEKNASKDLCTESEKLPAIPPNDYSGSIAEWEITLMEWGLLSPGEWYGDIMLPKEQYEQLLEICED